MRRIKHSNPDMAKVIVEQKIYSDFVCQNDNCQRAAVELSCLIEANSNLASQVFRLKQDRDAFRSAAVFLLVLLTVFVILVIALPFFSNS